MLAQQKISGKACCDADDPDFLESCLQALCAVDRHACERVGAVATNRRERQRLCPCRNGGKESKRGKLSHTIALLQVAVNESIDAVSLELSLGPAIVDHFDRRNCRGEENATRRRRHDDPQLPMRSSVGCRSPFSKHRELILKTDLTENDGFRERSGSPGGLPSEINVARTGKLAPTANVNQTLGWKNDSDHAPINGIGSAKLAALNGTVRIVFTVANQPGME